MNIVFMGTPDFAVPVLDAIVEKGFSVTAVITQPDRPQGRGNKIMPGPVKKRASELGIPVYQFEKLRKQEGLDCLRALKPDICVTAAFGQILSKKLLEVPTHGTINVHASLLPRHRGSAPINRAIQCGDEVTGVTTMLTDAGVDTGDMLLSRSIPITDDDTAGTLTEKLSHLSAELITETLDLYIRGEITPVKQDEAQATHEPMLTREDARVDWTRSAREVSCFIRGMSPWPCAWSLMGENTVKIYHAEVFDHDCEKEAGEVVLSSAKTGLIVKCGSGCVRISEIQAPGAKRMTDKAYLAGKSIPVGTRFI